jgi:hypothetical protein
MLATVRQALPVADPPRQQPFCYLIHVEWVAEQKRLRPTLAELGQLISGCVGSAVILGEGIG